jgi:uncharacterized YigZ family protein
MMHTSTGSPEYDHRQDDDAYLTITGTKETEIKILSSRFLSYALPVADMDGFMRELDALRRRFHDATHHCYAIRLGSDGRLFRFSDDGEPSGTAGKRILTAIDKLQLTNTAVVVVRWFGGVKLGVGGLARAYADAAEAALACCRIVTRYITDSYAITFPYDMTSQVHHALEKHEAVILERVWHESAEYHVRVRRSRSAALLGDISELTQRLATVQPLTQSPAPE